MLRKRDDLRLPHAVVGDAGVQEDHRHARTRALVVDARAVDRDLHHVRAVSKALNFSSVSSSSRAGSESGALTDDENGRSVSTTNLDARRCSTASFLLMLSSAARRSSSASVPPRATEPAIGCENAYRPVLRTRSSGEAPANAVPSAPEM